MKIARKPTKSEVIGLAVFIFNEDLEENGLFAWWVPLVSDLVLVVKRLKAIWAVKKAAVNVFDACWMEQYGYVDRVMTVRWRPGQVSDETQDTFTWIDKQLQIVPPGTKFWQRALTQRQALEPRRNLISQAYSVNHR